MSDNSAFKDRRKTSNRPLDVFVVLFCITGAAASLYLFYQDLYVSFRSSSETQAGVVVVRQNIVHRRLNDRLVWDRLFTDTPVYNGDVIRVARLSGAELNIDESQIELGENTLIRIQKYNDLLKIDFYSGEINIASNSDGPPVHLSFGDSVVEASPGSVLSASSDDSGAVLRITEGKAYIIQEGNVSQVLTAAPNKEVIILQDKADGRLEAVSEREARERQEEFQTLRLTLQQTLLEEEIARQVSMSEALPEASPRQDLSRPLEKTEETSLSAPALVPEIEAEALPAFVVYEEPPVPVPPPAPTLAQAPPAQTPTPASSPQPVPRAAQRTTPAPAVRAVPAPAATPTVATPAPISAPAPQTSVTQTPGTQPTAPESITQTSNTQPAAPESVTLTSTTQPVQAEVITETIAEEQAITQAPAQSMRPLFPVPQNMLPANGYRLGAEQIRQNKSIVFSWSKVEGANSYILTILKENTLRPERIFQTEISDNTQKYTFDNFRLLDSNGTYIWQLEAISYNSDDIIDRRGRPGESKFIMDVPRPGRVRVREMGILYGTE